MIKVVFHLKNGDKIEIEQDETYWSWLRNKIQSLRFVLLENELINVNEIARIERKEVKKKRGE